MGARGHKERTAFQSIKSHVGVLGPEREVRNGGEIVVSAELAAKEEAAAALLGSHNCNKKKKSTCFFYGPLLLTAALSNVMSGIVSPVEKH